MMGWSVRLGLVDLDTVHAITDDRCTTLAFVPLLPLNSTGLKFLHSWGEAS